jgi:hypothetical protein
VYPYIFIFAGIAILAIVAGASVRARNKAHWDEEERRSKTGDKERAARKAKRAQSKRDRHN